MGRLLLIRHAKAADGGVDAERPLTDRGRRAAAALATYLGELGPAPDLVVVSPSRRTVQTWELAGGGVAPVSDERVYENTTDALLTVISETPPDVETLAVVGHNPSIAELAGVLDDRTGDERAVALVRRGFPAGAVAVFDVPTPLAELRPGGAALIGFRAPAD